LRGTESAVQAVSVSSSQISCLRGANSWKYGLNSVPIFADVGGVYLNFGLWALALIPGWIIVKEIGVTLGDRKLERESLAGRTEVKDQDHKGS
jgi:hypothetical protein